MPVLAFCGCGVKYYPPPPPEQVKHFLLHGQSLSVGVKGQPVISLSQPYNNLTFAGGPRADLDELYDVKPLVEDDTEAPDGHTDAGETACSGAANYATQLSGGSLVVFASTVGHSNYRIDQLNKGTYWYDNYLIDHVTAAHGLVDWYGNEHEVPVLGWIQGASDQLAGTAKDTYKTLKKQLRSDVDTDVKAITGQATTVKMLTGQTAYYSRLNQKVPQAQYEASKEDPDIYMVCPQYQFVTADGSHLTNVGYKHFGYLFGRVMWKLLNGQGWEPLWPTSVTAVGTVITISFNVPTPPLVWDTTWIPEATDYGFEVRDDTRLHTINDIQIVGGGTQVQITVQNALEANPRVTYAYEYLSPGWNITGGASGNLRDSDSANWSHAGQTYYLRNWCVAFEEPIQ